MIRQRVWQPEYWGFVVVAVMSWLIIYGCLATSVPHARVDITDRDAVVGTWAPEPEGVWSNGDTHITVPYLVRLLGMLLSRHCSCRGGIYWCG